MALSKVDYNSLNVTAAASKALKWNSGADGFETGDVAGSMVLLATETASASATVSFTSDIDSTYDEYVFKFYDIHPSNDSVDFQFNLSIDAGSNYNVDKASIHIRADHEEDDASAALGYDGDDDHFIGGGTAFQRLTNTVGSGADESCAGYLHLFDPADTTVFKHFYASTSNYSGSNPLARHSRVTGMFGTTSAIDAVRFQCATGEFDGVIQMYGVA